jgi:hypothetical protein
MTMSTVWRSAALMLSNLDTLELFTRVRAQKTIIAA